MRVDADDSTLSITGGTGAYRKATGTMDLHARGANGSTYDFTFPYSADGDRPASGPLRWTPPRSAGAGRDPYDPRRVLARGAEVRTGLLTMPVKVTGQNAGQRLRRV